MVHRSLDAAGRQTRWSSMLERGREWRRCTAMLELRVCSNDTLSSLQCHFLFFTCAYLKPKHSGGILRQDIGDLDTGICTYSGNPHRQLARHESIPQEH